MDHLRAAIEAAEADHRLHVEEVVDVVEVVLEAIQGQDHQNVVEEVGEDDVVRLHLVEEDHGDGLEATADLAVVHRHAEDGPKEIEVAGIMTMIEEEDHLKDTVGDLLKMIIVAIEEAMTIVVVAETIMELLEEEEAREVMVLHRCTADHQVQEMHMDHQEEEVDHLHPP
ncbi:hypothetical protein FRACYDRAFT_224483 [Fragilariopsis cylindrus CCMP1102]|uniref:Uncharacterized protein n=1 Tax=Fragilariopsis cylindrus CCMP1102 TaxID=635003 RepID=A0A1E7FN89_9STRA|nr:hypothetical protein FRACYDRAFT_224483 [Fragilariopsis cylindrus CCMP1102]|eukprot:OEU19628.1 hypothetical protein FRACYDRAFT_224483 [Fragilariopsis cylindrus CCMP1102]